MPARSKSQQRLFGMVHAYQKGKLKNAPEEVKNIARSISSEDAEHFAKTKHKGLPEKKAYVWGFMDKCAELGLLKNSAVHSAVKTLFTPSRGKTLSLDAVKSLFSKVKTQYKPKPSWNVSNATDFPSVAITRNAGMKLPWTEGLVPEKGSVEKYFVAGGAPWGGFGSSRGGSLYYIGDFRKSRALRTGTSNFRPYGRRDIQLTAGNVQPSAEVARANRLYATSPSTVEATIPRSDVTRALFKDNSSRMVLETPGVFFTSFVDVTPYKRFITIAKRHPEYANDIRRMLSEVGITGVV